MKISAHSRTHAALSHFAFRCLGWNTAPSLGSADERQSPSWAGAESVHVTHRQTQDLSNPAQHPSQRPFSSQLEDLVLSRSIGSGDLGV